mgnify:FL=1
MGLLRAADFFYTLRFLRLLTTPWNKTNAFKLGIVDAKGNKLRKPETPEEKKAYNSFHKLVYNLKRLLNKLPFGRTSIASYAAALYLIKENTGMSDKKIGKTLEEVAGYNPTKDPVLKENHNGWFLTEDGDKIQTGEYIIVRDIALPATGELLALNKSRVSIKEHAPVGSIFGLPVFKAQHLKTQQSIFITQEDITRC